MNWSLTLYFTPHTRSIRLRKLGHMYIYKITSDVVVEYASIERSPATMDPIGDGHVA